jgi:hypothetical protein
VASKNREELELRLAACLNGSRQGGGRRYSHVLKFTMAVTAEIKAGDRSVISYFL